VASSIPTLLPPMKPVPTSREAMRRMSARVRYLWQSSNIFESLPMSICMRRVLIDSWSSGGRLRASRARLKVTFQKSGRSEGCWMVEKSAATSELAVTLVAVSSSIRWGKNMVGEYRCHTLRGWM